MYCEIFSVNEKPRFDWTSVLKNARMSEENIGRYIDLVYENIEREGTLKITEDSETGNKMLELTEKGKKKAKEYLVQNKLC